MWRCVVVRVCERAASTPCGNRSPPNNKTTARHFVVVVAAAGQAAATAAPAQAAGHRQTRRTYILRGVRFVQGVVVVGGWCGCGKGVGWSGTQQQDIKCGKSDAREGMAVYGRASV